MWRLTGTLKDRLIDPVTILTSVLLGGLHEFHDVRDLLFGHVLLESLGHETECRLLELLKIASQQSDLAAVRLGEFEACGRLFEDHPGQHPTICEQDLPGAVLRIN